MRAGRRASDAKMAEPAVWLRHLDLLDYAALGFFSALAAGLGIGDCKGCSSSALQEVWGPPVPPAAYPRGYTNSPGYNYSYGYKISNAKRQRHGRH